MPGLNILYAITGIIILFMIYLKTKLLIKRKKLNYGKYPRHGLEVFLWIMARNVFTPINGILEELYKFYGRTFWVVGPSKAGFVAGDVHLIKQICVKNFQNFTHRLNFPVVGDVIMDHTIVYLQNPKWKNCRNLMTPIFTLSKLKQMLPLINIRIQNLVNKLEKNSEKGEHLDIKDVLDQFTLEAIAVSAFDSSMVHSKERNAHFLSHSLKIIHQFNTFSLSIAAYLPRIFGLYSAVTSRQKSIQFFEELVKSSFERRNKEETKENGQRTIDLIELFLKHQKEGTTNLASPKVISLELLTSCCISFLMAGFETTATALSCIIFCLAKNPYYQEKILQEALESEKTGNDTTKNKPLLEAFISECLRLYPPVPFMARTAVNDCSIEGMDFVKGTIVIIPVCAIHKDPEYFPNPEKFYPERFLDGNYNVDAFLPFGMGPRNCLGITFSLMEIKETLIQLVKNFRFFSHMEELEMKAQHPLLIPKKVVLKIVKRESKNNFHNIEG